MNLQRRISKLEEQAPAESGDLQAFQQWMREREAWLKSPWAPFDHELGVYVDTSLPDRWDELQDMAGEVISRAELGVLSAEEREAVEAVKEEIHRLCRCASRSRVGLTVVWDQVESWWLDVEPEIAGADDVRSEIDPTELPEPPYRNRTLTFLANHIGERNGIDRWWELPESHMLAMAVASEARSTAGFAAGIAACFKEPWYERKIALEGMWPGDMGLTWLYPGEMPPGWSRTE